MISDLTVAISLTERECLDFADGFYPPRRQDYISPSSFLTDAHAYWQNFHASMRDNGVDPCSTLLAGCLPTVWAVGDEEFSAAKTAQAN